MRQSKLFTKTLKDAPKDETSLNARFLERGGFVYKNSAGVYSYLPLGWRVIEKIGAIIRDEMDAIGGQEMLMPALVEKKYLDATGRWDVPIGFEARGKKDKKAGFVLGWTHEEVLTAIVSRFVHSYKDLPFSAYQIQTKFRNELRAKAGVLRGREFLMKDLYSFHASQEDFLSYYEDVRGAYDKIFKRCGLLAIYTLAGGGDFTLSNTHEFQVPVSAGEDTIFVCGKEKCAYAENKEISSMKAGGKCLKCGEKSVEEKKSIEVGNIFPLGTKYSQAMGLTFLNGEGKKEHVVMGSYGIGLSRVMGTIVEAHHDERGIVWPKEVAPLGIHLLALGSEKIVRETSEKFYEDLQKRGLDVLYDDRGDKTAGEKFADADLIGIPLRLVISAKSLQAGGVEIKERKDKDVRIESVEKFFNNATQFTGKIF